MIGANERCCMCPQLATHAVNGVPICDACENIASGMAHSGQAAKAKRILGAKRRRPAWLKRKPPTEEAA
jgi:hypothetical protein